jgi:hypothetical protein
VRPKIVLMIALLTAACGEPSPPTFRKLEIFAPGLEITIDGQGAGSFLRRSQRANDRSGRFSLTSAQYDALVRRLEVYRNSEDAKEKVDFDRVFMQAPHCDISRSDQGGITFHWDGPEINQFYTVDYGCDAERNVRRNSDLRAILESLPVPEPESLP